MVKKGDIVEGVVTGIVYYGVFVLIDNEIKGIIHIKKVKNDYILDLHDYFRVGDMVKGEIVNIDHLGRVEISTIGFDLPNYAEEEPDNAFSKLTVLKQTLEEQEVKPINLMNPKEEKEEFSPDILHVFQIVEKIIGEELSEKAKIRIERDINEYGIVNYVLELGKKEHFALDKGLAFHQLIMEDVKFELSKLHFSVSDHALEQWCSDRFEGCNEWEKATAEIIQRASYGVLFKKVGNHIYIRSGDYILPCIEEKEGSYVIKTILTPELYYAQLNQSYKK